MLAPPNLLQLQTIPASRLRNFATGGYLYALLDAYDNPAIPPKVQKLGKEHAVCLFVGEAEKKYWDLAPYLIGVDEATLDWMAETIWRAPWGVFVLSKSGLETLRTHFRRFLMVQLPDGERWFFRYYDPRILKIYLSNCRPDELQLFFGPVRAFGVPEQDSESVVLLHAGIETNQVTTSASSSPVLCMRREQFEAIERAAQDNFEERMLPLLKNAFPSHWQTLGENGVRELVHRGNVRAATYHLTRENDRYQFIELMFLLDPNFDEDPNLPWVQSILHDQALPDPSARMARLWETASQVIAGRRSGQST